MSSLNKTSMRISEKVCRLQVLRFHAKVVVYQPKAPCFCVYLGYPWGNQRDNQSDLDIAIASLGVLVLRVPVLALDPCLKACERNCCSLVEPWTSLGQGASAPS